MLELPPNHSLQPDEITRYNAKTWWPIIVLGLACALLFADALSFKMTTEKINVTVIHGQGEYFAMHARHVGILEGGPVEAHVLEEFLEAEYASGLRYIGLLTPREHHVLVEAGSRTTSVDELEPGVPYDTGDSILFTVPAIHAKPARPADLILLDSVLPTPSTPFSGRPKQPRAMIVLEYEPLKARELSRHANLQLLGVFLTTLIVLGMAWKLGHVLRRQERLQALYQQRQRLAELGQMSAVLAHELRNPLTALKGHSQLLHEILEERHDVLTKKTSRLIYEATRLEDLVNSLLSFVRTGQLHLRSESVSDSMERLVESSHEDGIELTLSDQAVASSWQIDPKRMQIAISNILENAIQESPPGSPILVQVTRKGNQVVVNVEDCGPGIAPDTLAQIFEPFVTFKTNGVGLGLAIARSIIENHGGRISAHNKDPAHGAGARFQIEIPCAR